MRYLGFILLFNLLACSSKPPKPTSENFTCLSARKPYGTGLVFTGRSQVAVDRFLDAHELKNGQILLYQTSKASPEIKIFVYPLRHIRYNKTRNEYLFLPRYQPLQSVTKLAPYNKKSGFYFPQPKNFKEVREYKGEAFTTNKDVKFFYIFRY